MDNKRRNIYGAVAIAFLVASFVLVYLNVITYQEALQGAPVWAAVIFGIYNWRERVAIKKEAEVIQEMMSNRIERLKEDNEKLTECVHTVRGENKALKRTRK